LTAVVQVVSQFGLIPVQEVMTVKGADQLF